MASAKNIQFQKAKVLGSMQMTNDLPWLIRDLLNKRTPMAIDPQGSILKRSAVLIPLFKAASEYKILFTKRTDRVETHKGQISFPGGRIEEEDGSPLETALREADEEIGLSRKDVTVLGQMDDARTVSSNYIVHPFVGLIPYPYEFRTSVEEVKELLEVPFWVFLSGDSADERYPVVYEGVTYQNLAYRYKGEVIWGATARIMRNLVELVEEKLDLPVENR
jgi:8-oxo-dGTP pyrophosphatase MutT (NUDIX family)